MFKQFDKALQILGDNIQNAHGTRQIDTPLPPIGHDFSQGILGPQPFHMLPCLDLVKLELLDLMLTDELLSESV